MNTPFILRSVYLVLGLGVFAGCSTIKLDESGDMRATYVGGEFRMVVNANSSATAQATSLAFQQLGLFKIQNDLRTFEADMAARTELDEKVRVRIREINSRQSEVSIRVDVVGDKEYSQKLYQQIERNLSAGGGGAL